MILQLLSVILLVGVAEAGPIKVEQVEVQLLGKTEDRCIEYRIDGSVIKTTCPPGASCERRMKEAMLEIDEILRLNHGLLMDRDPGKPRICLNLSQNAYRQWERTMKECVK